MAEYVELEHDNAIWDEVRGMTIEEVILCSEVMATLIGDEKADALIEKQHDIIMRLIEEIGDAAETSTQEVFIRLRMIIELALSWQYTLDRWRVEKELNDLSSKS